MQYKVLRDCYVNDRLWFAGSTVELPDDMEKSPKNFEPVGAKTQKADKHNDEPEVYVSKKDREKLGLPPEE